VNARGNTAVFLSYASQDADAARRICEALRAAGVEVWFDQSELRGGDSWDAKIRKQIKECALFVPVISATTEARHEGYFRREWKLAVERTHDMAASRAFLLPVVIDATPETGAEVPEEFLRVQWTRMRHEAPAPDFVAQVKRLLDPLKKSHVSGHPGRVAEPTRMVAAGQQHPVGLPAKPRRRILLAALVVVAIVGLGIAAWIFRSKNPASATDLLEKSVAVLPFANLSGDPAQEHLSDGITEEIHNALAREHDLIVPGRASAFAFKGGKTPNAEIARALNVGQLVEGSFRRAGNDVRISVTLWRAADGRTDALTTVHRELKGTAEIFQLQDEIAGKVVQRLTRRAAIPPAELPTTNMEAYDLFLRARALQLRSSGPGSYQAMTQLEEVVTLDPSFAAAWARLAEIAANIGNAEGGFDMSHKTRRRAAFAAARAVELAPNLAEAYVARASVFLKIDADPEAAERELRTVERLQPQSPDLARMRVLIEAERNPASPRLVELANRAVALDPENPSTLFFLGRALSRGGQFARADDLLRRAAAVGRSQSAFTRRATNWIMWTGDLAGAIRLQSACPESDRNEIFYRTQAPWQEQRGDEVAARSTWEKALALARVEVQRPGIRSAIVSILTELAARDLRTGAQAAAEERLAEARAVLEALLIEEPENPNLQMRWVRWHEVRGDFSAARATLEAAEKDIRGAFRTEVFERAKAELLTATGAYDEAIAILRAAHERGRAFGYALRHETEFKPLHARPAFQQLLRDAEARADAIPRPKR
jgi:TolB-like protein/tetratricopeptide (TPR) repeat protein